MSELQIVALEGWEATPRSVCRRQDKRAGCENIRSWLETLEDRMGEGSLSKLELRHWERLAIDLLQDCELDLFMRAPDEGDDVTMAEQRCRNMRTILLTRLASVMTAAR